MAAETLPEVAYVETAEFLFSEEGKDQLRQDLQTRKPARVVLAACFTRDHEGTFRKVLAEADINPSCRHRGVRDRLPG